MYISIYRWAAAGFWDDINSGCTGIIVDCWLLTANCQSKNWMIVEYWRLIRFYNSDASGVDMICLRRRLSSNPPLKQIFQFPSLKWYRFRLHHNNKIESTVNTQPLSFSIRPSTVNSQQFPTVQPELIWGRDWEFVIGLNQSNIISQLMTNDWWLMTDD